MKKLFGFIVGLALCVGFSGASYAAEVYNVDKVHSSIGFAIAHLVVAKTTGSFDDYDADIQFDANDLVTSKLDFTVRPAGINTKNSMRDEHLRGADFFDVAKYPAITFKTRKITLSEGNNYVVTGDLTMKGVTREIEVPATILGPIKNPMNGAMNIGIEAHFTINRQDFGVSWNKALDNGGVMGGDIAERTVHIQAEKK